MRPGVARCRRSCRLSHRSIRHIPAVHVHLCSELWDACFHQGKHNEVFIQRSAGEIRLVLDVAPLLKESGLQ